MNRKIAFALFLTFAVVIAIGVNYYVVGRLWNLLGLADGLRFYITVAVLAFSFVLATFLVRLNSNIIFGSYYFLSSLWLGIMLVLLSLLMVFEIVNFIHPLPHFTSGIVILGAAFFITFYSIINAVGISVRKIDVPIGLGEEINIVQVSDVHLGILRTEKYLNKVVEKVNLLNPDIVVVTGDLFDGGTRMYLGEVKPLDKIKAPVYFVIGNHETYEGLEDVFKTLAKTKVKSLRNEIAMEKGIQIIGVDFSEDKNFLENALNNLDNKINKDKPSLLLYHTPVKMKLLTKHKINLHLAGHTHKGQVFPFNFLVRLAFRHIYGLHSEGDSYQYVSAGTGTWGPFMRLGSRNEVVRINIS